MKVSIVKLTHAIICIVILTVGGVSVDAVAKVTHKIYLTSKEKNGIPDSKPQTEFTCSDKIYAILEISGLSKTKHLLEAIWTDPKGKKRERTEFPLYISQDWARSWVWLRLHGPSGIGSSIVTAVDPAHGMDEFIGNWTISFYIDKKQLDKKQFSVLC